MLPLELLIARKYGDTLRPRFAEVTSTNIRIAERVITTYQQQQGARKAKVDAAIEALEGEDVDYRIIRGLAALVARRCRFEMVTALPPQQVRDRVFQAAAQQGIPVTLEARYFSHLSSGSFLCSNCLHTYKDHRYTFLRSLLLIRPITDQVRCRSFHTQPNYKGYPPHHIS